MRCLINERRGRIAVKAFDRRVKDELDVLEPDNQGYVQFRVLEDALVLYIKNQQKSRYATIFWALFAVTCVVFLGATFGLVYLVVDIHKDISAIDGQLVSRNTGSVLQTSSSQFQVQKGILLSRPSSQSQGRRSSDGGTLSIQTVAFSAELGSTPSSAWTPEQLSAITSLTITSSSLYGVYMNVQGFTIVPAPGQGIPGDKYVIFQIGGGLQLQLKGTDVTVPSPMSLLELLEAALPGAVLAWRRLAPPRPARAAPLPTPYRRLLSRLTLSPRVDCVPSETVAEPDASAAAAQASAGAPTRAPPQSAAPRPPATPPAARRRTTTPSATLPRRRAAPTAWAARASTPTATRRPRAWTTGADHRRCGRTGRARRRGAAPPGRPGDWEGSDSESDLEFELGQLGACLWRRPVAILDQGRAAPSPSRSGGEGGAPPQHRANNEI